MTETKTTFNCLKCNIEHVVDLYDDKFYMCEMYHGQEKILYDMECRNCGNRHSLEVELLWQKKNKMLELVRWNIKKVRQIATPVHTEHPRDMSGYDPLPERDTLGRSKSSGLTPKNHISKEELNNRIWKDYNQDTEMSQDKLLAVIWRGLVKLKIPAQVRREIMDGIERIVKEIENDDEGIDSSEE